MLEQYAVRQLAEIYFFGFGSTLRAWLTTSTSAIMLSPDSMPSVDDIRDRGLTDPELFSDVFQPFSFSPHFEDGRTFFRAKVAFLHKN
jgi:hypothetical protein